MKPLCLPMPRGRSMPALGFGTYELENDVAEEAVRRALCAGYRHVDTADLYNNHCAVGRAIANSGLPRGDLFLVTKIWRDRLRHDDLIADAQRALDELDTPYVDQLLIHWPNSDIPLAETMAAMAELIDAGLAVTGGVSNFTVEHLLQARSAAQQPIAANQVEMHPYLQQSELRDFCAKQDIAVVAYRPIARGRVDRDPVLRRIARRHGKTPVQVTLRWMLQCGVAAIPRSADPRHIRENFETLAFELDAQDVAAIGRLDAGRRYVEPDFAEFAGPPAP